MLDRRPFQSLALAIIHVLPFAAECEADWPCWRGTSHDGIAAEAIDFGGDGSGRIEILWRADVGTGFSAFVASKGSAITVGNQDDADTVYCFDANNGQTKWKFTYHAPLDDRDFEGGSTATPTIYDGQVFVQARQGELFCLNLQTGKVVWQIQVADLAEVRIPGWGFGGSPLVIDDSILLSAGESGIAIDRRNGKLLWKSADKEAGYASPMPFEFEGHSLAMFPSGRSFSAVDVVSGQVVWQQRWLTSFGCNAADPIVHDGHVLLSSGYNRGSALLKLDGSSVQTVWKSKELQCQLNACVLIDGYLYGVDGDMEAGPKLTCMEFATGNITWSDEDTSPGAISATANHLIIVSTDGELLIGPASTSEFTPFVQQKVLDGRCWTVPVLSEGRIFLRNATGSVVCVGLK